jgi:sugar/nucleoside kinase (ribokinase family)
MKKSTGQSQVLGIGTPLLDQIIHIDDAYLAQHHLRRGSTEPINYTDINSIIFNSNKTPSYVAGGSAANTIKGLSCLGEACALFGVIGDDEEGELLVNRLTTYGVNPLLKKTNLPTGQVLCLVTPDKERTMRFFLGAGTKATAQDITSDMFENITLVHTEGFMFNNGTLLEHSMKLAKAAGAKISLDTASFEIVASHKKQMLELISRYVDILFANEEEAHALTGHGPQKSARILKELCPIAIVKMGEHGCFVAFGKEELYHDALKVRAVDTTGAGDLFASGFLHGYLRKKSLCECAFYGNLVAAQVVQVMGAEIPESAWEGIKKQMHKGLCNNM